MAKNMFKANERGAIAHKAKKGTLRRTLSYLKPFKGLLVLVFLGMLVQVAGNVGGSLLLSPIIAGIYNEGNPTFLGVVFDSKSAFLLTMVYVLIVVYALSVIGNYVSNRCLISISTTTQYNIRSQLFNHMQTLPIKFFDTHTHGDLMSRYSNDIDNFNDLVARSLPQVLSSTLQVVVVFVSMWVLSWQLTLCVCVMLVLMVLLIKFFGKKAKTNFRDQQATIGEVNGYVEEMVDGQRVVKVFNHEKKVVEGFEDINDRWRKASQRANGYANMMMPIMSNLTNVFYIVIAVVGVVVAIQLPKDQIGNFLGVLASFLILLRQFANPINMVAQQVNVIFLALAGAERIFQVIDQPSETDNGYVTLVRCNVDDKGNITESQQRTGKWAWKHPHQDGTLTYTLLRGDVRFEDVVFGYEENKTVLNGISLYAKPGQKIAFVGSTGAGKTTITNLINRFYDVPDGKIRYDGININKIKKADLRRSLGMVLQDTHLFTGTVMDNIRYGRLDATDEQCIEAAKRANAHFFISHLPNGYDTLLAGDGGNLSQGQRQLIAIARAAVADPPVMILDEATSSIDTRTEWLIEKGMDALMEGRTTFVIAHRLSTVRNSNAIMVLENGKIIERGDHDELIAQKGKYYQLYTGAFELS